MALRGYSAPENTKADSTGYIIKSKKPAHNPRSTSFVIEVLENSKSAGVIQYGLLDKDGALVYLTSSNPDGKISFSIFGGTYSAIKILTMGFDTLEIPLLSLYGHDVKIEIKLKPTVFTDRIDRN